MELIENLIDLHRDQAKQVGISLIQESHGPTPTHGDPERLRQLLSNLLGNALRFAPAGSQVTMGNLRSSRQLLVWVEDDEPGIPKEQRSLVFERFWQADSSRTGGHTGPGLAIALGIARQHGGKLQASAGQRGGCRMELHLPRS